MRSHRLVSFFLRWIAGAGNTDEVCSLARRIPLDSIRAVAFAWAAAFQFGCTDFHTATAWLPIFALDSFLVFSLLLMVSSWAVRIRAKTLLKNTLTYRLFRPVQRGITAGGKKIGTAGHSFFEKLPLFWQAGVLFAGLCFLEGLCIIGMVAGVFFGVILWFLLKLAEAVLIVYMVLSLRTLQKGGKSVEGKFSYAPIDNLRLTSGARRNLTTSGRMEAAVQEQVRQNALKRMIPSPTTSKHR